MSSQMVRGVVWNPFPVRHAGPQYNVAWLVLEESVGLAVLNVVWLVIVQSAGRAVPVRLGIIFIIFKLNYSKLSLIYIMIFKIYIKNLKLSFKNKK